MTPPRMTEPLEAPSGRAPRNPTTIILAVLAGVGGTCCIGFILLAAVLFPVFRQARLAAQNSGCMSNLRQIGVSMNMYAASNDEQLPDANNWMDDIKLTGVRERQLHCPAVGRFNRSVYGYAFNKSFSKKPLHGLDTITPIVFDSTLLGRNANSDESTVPIPGRHTLKGKPSDNVLLLDGSVQQQPADLSDRSRKLHFSR